MATLKIWESVRRSGDLPLLRIDERTVYQSVAFTGTPGTSAGFAETTTVLCVKADAACAVRIGVNPTAIVNDYPIAANTMQEFSVAPGSKISVIAT